MSMHAAWIDGMQHAPVLEVAHALGLREQGKALTSWCIAPCPACFAERRHTKTEATDRSGRGPIGVARSKPPQGWRCFQCDASGSTIDLVAYVLCGKRYRELRDHERATVKEWCERWTHTEPARAAQREPERAPDPPPSYPPIAEVQELYEACTRVDLDEVVRDYLAFRRLSAPQIADLDVARALPTDADVPGWARRWQSSGHRLIVPLYDARGDMRSVLARAVVPTEPKSRSLGGFTRAGLVMMCPFARWLVRAGTFPDWWPSHTALRVIVAEGEIDFLTWVTEFSESTECAPATIGLVGGTWSSDIAARIPDGATVLVATHNDPPGDGYAARVVETLRGRKLRLERWDAAEGSL